MSDVYAIEQEVHRQNRRLRRTLYLTAVLFVAFVIGFAVYIVDLTQGNRQILRYVENQTSELAEQERLAEIDTILERIADEAEERDAAMLCELQELASTAHILITGAPIPTTPECAAWRQSQEDGSDG